MQSKGTGKGSEGSGVGRRGLCCLILLMLLLAPASSPAHTMRLADRQPVTLVEMVADLRRARVVLIGESHNNPHHHQAQLQLLKSLEAAGAKVALGLEMFRADRQPVLDQWVAGRLDFAQLRQVFHDNWERSRQYDEIFRYARERRLPMIGLNISRRITRQVAEQGFAALAPELLAQLPPVQCVVSPAYRRFIDRVLGREMRNS